MGRTWKPGDRLRHRHNPALGAGRVVSAEGRSIVVEFPETETTLTFAGANEALAPLEIAAGMWARLETTGERVLIETRSPDGGWRLADGRTVPGDVLWPVDVADSPVDLLAQGEIEPVDAFALRLDAMHFASVREAGGLGSFLGGRIRLFPHQLHVAERATRSDPVRWLLADEVGLGKTVEACLILNHLVRARRTERTLVVAPETLVVQWLGELWRKYHQVFVLVDEPRLADVAKDHGTAFNPFDTYRKAVVAIETLIEHPRLVDQAVEAGIDLLIVDEAHRLQRPPGHPGNQAYRAIAAIAALGGHVLLLTATPLEDDAHGFFRLLQLLRPEEFPEDGGFEARLAAGTALPPCTSSTRRSDIGGLPPRVPAPVTIEDPAGWAAVRDLESAVLALPADNAATRRAKARIIARALSSGAAAAAVLGRFDPAVRALASTAQDADPRIRWLAGAARRWQEAGEKTLVFTAYRETLEALRAALSRLAQIRTGVFHEDLPTAERDLEVAQFRQATGPSVLISTECGGEGRNFEFCRRIVLFDLPWSPGAVEQRIGRLDRIGRERPVEIVYVRPPGGLAAAIADLYERIGLFREPLGTIERELAHVEAAIEEAAASGRAELPSEVLDGILAETTDARERTRAAAYHELHRDPYVPAMADAIFARVPDDLDELAEEIVLAACDQLAIRTEPRREETVWSIELGRHARVESLPGVPAGSSFVGTFDRAIAVEDETIDYFATGHALVEGILAEIEDGPIGRAALLGLDGPEPAFGLLALYARRPGFEAVCIDAAGQLRPDWAAALTRRPLRTRRIKADALVRSPEWASTIRRLADLLGRAERPAAVAAVIVGAR